MSAPRYRCDRVGVLFAVAGCWTASAEAVPWLLFEDPVAGAVCDVVNAANTELVVLDDTGELVIVRGPDTVLPDTFVDVDATVFFRGVPAGFLAWAEDGDDLPTLWWFFADLDVANVNEFTGEPTPTGFEPADFVGTACDACEFWDDPVDCPDEDLDGVGDDFDLCPGTPPAEPVDMDGCSIGGGAAPVRLCGTFGGLPLAMMLCGLTGLRLSAKRF